jgi:hypothetical protein
MRTVPPEVLSAVRSIDPANKSVRVGVTTRGQRDINFLVQNRCNDEDAAFRVSVSVSDIDVHDVTDIQNVMDYWKREIFSRRVE